MGYLHVDKTKTTSERLHFGVKFRKALNEFTKKFLPHMKEEEEVSKNKRKNNLKLNSNKINRNSNLY
jgi:hypothetical protein